uniref:Secreted frizzled related protein n=1 Tax=Xenoturbella bocki TaxID=242395 RepID=A0A2P1DV62_XENBC|nr:secreted frizzled related protein [Xenoturbella bocki]
MVSCSSSLLASVTCLLLVLSEGTAAQIPEDDRRIITPRCVPIPSDLHLCQGVDWTMMRMPNHLDHDTLGEVKRQSGIWTRLVDRNCHADTKIFLCSLFAPVCLPDHDEPIYPCRSVCENVRGACAFLMASYGFPWPDMLACDGLPENEMCLQTASSESVNATAMTSEVPSTEVDIVEEEMRCRVCEQAGYHGEEILTHHYCASEFAIRVKVKEVESYRDLKIVASTRKITFYKRGPLRKRQIVEEDSLDLWIKDGARCACDIRPKTRYIFFGIKLDETLFVTAFVEYDRSIQGLKRAVRTIRSDDIVCP